MRGAPLRIEPHPAQQPAVPCQYNTLREANLARQAEWATTPLSLSFVANELAGECGELQTIIQYLVGRMEVPRIEIEQELADVAICLDLAAIKVNRPPLSWGQSHQFCISEPLQIARDALWLGGRVGLVSNIFKKLDREVLGLKGSRASEDDVTDVLTDAARSLGRLADGLSIDLDRAIARKFNETSRKVGLMTRMVEA